MSDDAPPLVDALDAGALESARRDAAARESSCERLIYVYQGGDATLADELARVGQYFEISAVRVVAGGVGVFGAARAESLARENEPEPKTLARLLETAIVDAAARQRDTASKLRDVERMLQRRTIQLLEADRGKSDSRAEQETFERKLRLAQQQIDKTKNTLSFRLGHALIHNTKSIKGLIELPRTLWNLNQDARTRRGNADGRLQRISRVVTQLRQPVASKPPGAARPRVARPPVRQFAAPFPLATGADLKKLRVACIFDDFTMHSYAPECELIVLRPDTWRAQVEAQRPHLLFVESAWHGPDKSWDRKINQLAIELRELVQWCHEASVPTAFWNKEDPVHFGTFLNTAALFDVVFTTDFDCIHRYKQLLDHDRVYLLPFACQPRQHNPIEKFERKNAACFAGAYYARYPERQRDFLRMMIQLLERGPVEIFDRNHGKTDPDYQFPASYRDYIVGNLPFSEIDRAYKGYRYAININSIKTSQTMFARRVFELLASNTLTISNYSKGIRLLFGELVIATDDPARLATRLRELDHDEAAARVLRLIGLRKAMAEHTYEDRLAYIASKVFGCAPPVLLPTITVVGAASTSQQAQRLVDAFERQRHAAKRLAVIAPSALHAEILARVPGARFVEGAASAQSLIGEGEFVARFARDDFYGEHYLEDLALATRYFDGPVIGKAARWQWSSDGPVRIGGAEYHSDQPVPSAAAIIRRDRLDGTIAELVDADRVLDGAFAIDELNYCAGGGAHVGDARLSATVGEPQALDGGLSLTAIIEQAEAIQPPDVVDVDLPALGPAELVPIFPDGPRGSLIVSHGPEGMTIESTLAVDAREYLYQHSDLPLAALGFDTRAQFHLEVTSGLRLQAVFLFFDQHRKRIGEAIKFAAMNHEVELPAGAVYTRFGILVVGPGSATVRRLVLGLLPGEEPTRFPGKSRFLLVTNGYPSADALYRNGFVHRRVLDYRRSGVEVDVMCHRPREPLTFHEFEGTDVVTGNADVLRRVLDSNSYDSVLVHFLDEEIWAQLRTRLDSLRVYIWIHGADIHPWQRRRYNLVTPEDIESAKSASARRVALWSDVFRNLHRNIHFVTVSRTFASEIEEDYKVSLPAAQHTVIHNVIDTELFQYIPKPASQRTKILLVRPFATRQYANDLAVAAIVELSKQPWFSELDFHIIGDGVLFDDTVAPLRDMQNVIVERRFVRQEEIAALHREHGVFLCPTRWDSQGVSRDEAMSSGLVPVTTRIAAVPEMVDADCAFLAPPEDASGLARAIETLYRDPALFQRMSERAAARIRRDRSAEQTTQRELALFTRR